MRAAVLVSALLLAAPATAQLPTAPAPASGAIDPARLALALELARELNSEALTRAQLGKISAETMPRAFAQNPAMAALEKQYPGAIAAVMAAMTPVIVDYTIGLLPKLWTEIAPIYARSLDPAELRQLLAFYRGPTGQRVIAAMGRGSDYGATLSRMVNEGTTAMTAGDLRNGATPGIAEVVRTASDEDKAAMVALVQTSAGRKLPAVTTEVMAAVAAASARPDPVMEKRIEQVVKTALDAHIKKSGKR
ncbi:DUF2059 domain-containing protein [Sphingomonas sp. RS2018]